MDWDQGVCELQKLLAKLWGVCVLFRVQGE